MFFERLRAISERKASLLCVGLDPDLAKLPKHLAGRPDALFQFNRAIIDATDDLVCAFKPQIAYYAASAAEEQLAETIRYIKQRGSGSLVILDAKRGDIGPTAEMYAREAFERFDADAVTVNPYMGYDAVEPFVARKDRGVFVLCRTSNPSAATFQDLPVDDTPLYQRVAVEAAGSWNQHRNVGLVVGATYPEQMSQLRAAVGDMPFLVPGVGSQGASVEAAVRSGVDARGGGLVISSSRAIIFASSGEDFASAAREAALPVRNEIRRAAQQ